MQVRFQVSKPVLCGNEKKYVNDALDSAWISSNGTYLREFEAALARYMGVEECLATSNGTTALHLACLALGLKPGDEVIVPALTYVASANAITYCGARPIFCDSDELSWNATAQSIQNVWTKKTVGVMAVHLYGLPCDVSAIAKLCRDRGAWLIEDCAESLGATVDGRHTGTFGDAATFSFYGNKTISTGEGGALFIRDQGKREHAKMLRGQGMDLNRRYWHPIVGYNYRMTNIAAAIGLGQLEMLDFHLSERRRIAQTYAEQLTKLRVSGEVELQEGPETYQSSHWLFSLVLKHGAEQLRERVMSELKTRHLIETRPFFTPMHKLPMYENGLELANCEYLASRGMNLPTYTGLQDAEIVEIVAAIETVLAANR